MEISTQLSWQCIKIWIKVRVIAIKEKFENYYHLETLVN